MPTKQLSSMVSANAAARRRLLKQDHRHIYRGAMLRSLEAKPEIVLVSLPAPMTCVLAL